MVLEIYEDNFHNFFFLVLKFPQQELNAATATRAAQETELPVCSHTYRRLAHAAGGLGRL